MSHALEKPARHRVWADAHASRINLRLALPWLLGATGLAVAMLADAAPIAGALRIGVGLLSDAAIMSPRLLGVFSLMRLRGARMLQPQAVEAMRMCPLAAPRGGERRRHMDRTGCTAARARPPGAGARADERAR